MNHRTLFLVILLNTLSETTFAQAGEVVCWGLNDYGQCDAPIGRFIKVAGGFNHSMALDETGSLVCWGDNQFGQCNSPQGTFTDIAAGSHHCLAIRADGTVAAWGSNEYGESTPLSGAFIKISATVSYTHLRAHET